MNAFLILTFLFFVGSLSGWGIEVVFRRYFSSANPERKWINPGFCSGPYLPIYGCGLCVLYLLAGVEDWLPIASSFWRKAVLFAVMAVAMTVVEYVAGLLCLKVAKVRLWDYSENWGNVQGLICPKFSLAWALLGAVYYFLIHPHVLGALNWLAENLAFSFVIGFFFGVFLIDVVHSAQLVVKLRQWARENDVIVRYEALKAQIRRRNEAEKKKYHFYRPFRSDRPLAEHLREMRESLEKRIHK